jgi:C1A family cysteine protease
MIANTLIALTLVAGAAALSEDATSMLLSDRFESFKIAHSKVYANAAEHSERLAIFEKNVEIAAQRNAEARKAGHAEVHGVTRFADMTEVEYSAFLGVDATQKAQDMPILAAKALNSTLTGSFNWGDSNMLTPVKDQQQCGSCWAFSATETIETAWARAGNPLTEFSPQQMVSCDKTDAGCNGGLPGNAFDYVHKSGGLASEADYPYTSGKGKTGTCTTPLPEIAGGSVGTWGYAQDKCQGFTPCVEDSAALAATLQQYGPMSIAIDASSWNSYRGGVLASSSCSNSPRKMDHAVQLVGYNADAETPYWIVRNSWNTGWGEDGFIWLAMGDNTCGIVNLAALVETV